MHKHPPPPPSCQLSGTVRYEALVCFVHPTKIYIRMKKPLFNDKHRPCDSSPAWGAPLQRYARHYSRSHPLDPTTPPSTVCSNNTCLFFCCQIPRIPQVLSIWRDPAFKTKQTLRLGRLLHLPLHQLMKRPSASGALKRQRKKNK